MLYLLRILGQAFQCFTRVALVTATSALHCTVHFRLLIPFSLDQCTYYVSQLLIFLYQLHQALTSLS